MAETSRYIDETGLQHLAESIDSRFATKTSLTAHTTNTSNPHKVTAEQVGAYSKTESDTIFETKNAANKKLESYGIEMKYVDANTLQFYRPSTLPNPIYELPITTFTGSSSAIVATSYILFPDSTYGGMDNWTLFYNVLANTCTNGEQRLLDCACGYNDTTNVSAQIVSGNANATGSIAWGYSCVGATSYYKSSSTVGKVAFRKSSSLPCIQYSIDGSYWIDTTIEHANCRQRDYDSDKREDLRMYLSFGGSAATGLQRPGNGVISAKLWDSALNDISLLFN